MKPRKLFGYAVAAFFVYFAVTNPTQAAGIVRDAATGVSTFAAALSEGGQ